MQGAKGYEITRYGIVGVKSLDHTYRPESQRSQGAEHWYRPKEHWEWVFSLFLIGMEEEYSYWCPKLFDALNLIKNEIYMDYRDEVVADFVAKASIGIPITRRDVRWLFYLSSRKLKELQSSIDWGKESVLSKYTLGVDANQHQRS